MLNRIFFAIVFLGLVPYAFSQWNTNGSDIYFNTGDVGIGTSSPSEKLHVAGTILSNELLLNDPNSTSDWNTIWQSGFFQSYNAINAPETGPTLWFWGINLNHSANNSTYRYSYV